MAPYHLLSSLPSALRKSPGQSASQSSIEAGNDPDLPWEELGAASEYLLPELRKMYWAGVKRELTHILLTLHEWQLPKYSAILLEDEEDDFIHGYDTFLDQVCYDSRAFALRYGTSAFVFDYDVCCYSSESLHYFFFFLNNLTLRRIIKSK